MKTTNVKLRKQHKCRPPLNPLTDLVACKSCGNAVNDFRFGKNKLSAKRAGQGAYLTPNRFGLM